MLAGKKFFDNEEVIGETDSLFAKKIHIVQKKIVSRSSKIVIFGVSLWVATMLINRNKICRPTAFF